MVRLPILKAYRSNTDRMVRVLAEGSCEVAVPIYTGMHWSRHCCVVEGQVFSYTNEYQNRTKAHAHEKKVDLASLKVSQLRPIFHMPNPIPENGHQLTIVGPDFVGLPSHWDKIDEPVIVADLGGLRQHFRVKWERQSSALEALDNKVGAALTPR